MKFARNDTDVLILWDVDHTLIETRGVGRAAFAEAFETVTGERLEQMPHITGRTEPDIYAATAALHGITQPPEFPFFAEALAQAYLRRQDDLGSQGRAMPGAAEALAHLATIPWAHQSVLTGNTRAVTRVKLETFGLLQHLDLEIGAYGDDNGNRPALVAIAQQRAADSGAGTFDRGSTVLIGDSPADVDTALRGGARVVAVAAGGTPAEKLSGADAVLADLCDASTLATTIHSLANR
ncbi:HAD family hydrolase [Nocardia sp. NPDC004722]